MSQYPLAIDFDAVRTTLCALASTATSLPPSQVMVLQPEAPNAPRPAVPYIGIMVTSPSTQRGQDWVQPIVDAPGGVTGLVAYTGVRTMSVSFECFGATHEQAYGILCTLQAMMQTPVGTDVLALSNLAVYRVGAVADLSTLLNTAFEGRAQMDVTFGMTSSLVVDTGRIDSVDITGVEKIDGEPDVSIDLTETRS